MFLAINELIKEKTRFVLISLVILLVSYLAFFLTALAYGLATSYTKGLNKWDASGIVLQKDANNNIARSLISKKDYASVLNEDSALLGSSSATIEAMKTEDVALFGIDFEQFLAPNITEGRGIEGPNEVITSDELRQIGVALGQQIAYKGSDITHTVVGFTDDATFQTAPIVYMDLPAWRTITADLSGMSGMKDASTVSALVTKSNVNPDIFSETTLQWSTINDYSFSLPGYNAQVITFSTMIGFLIVIASFVLAIFMYILTLQKKSIFGVLKAEGIPSAYIARSVLIQAVILAGLGMLAGLGLTIVTGAVLPSQVPFLVQPLFFVGIALLFLMCAALGGLASVRTVTKIDPVEAIG